MISFPLQFDPTAQNHGVSQAPVLLLPHWLTDSSFSVPCNQRENQSPSSGPCVHTTWPHLPCLLLLPPLPLLALGSLKELGTGLLEQGTLLPRATLTILSVWNALLQMQAWLAFSPSLGLGLNVILPDSNI